MSDQPDGRADEAEHRADRAEERADQAEHRADDAAARQDASDTRQDVRVVDIDERLEAIIRENATLAERLEGVQRSVDADLRHRIEENVLRDRRIKWSRRSTVASMLVAVLAVGVAVNARATSAEVCAAARKNRDVLVQLVLLGDDGGLHPEQVPGFDALTPEDQAYWLALADLLNSDGEDGSFKDRALKLLEGDPCG